MCWVRLEKLKKDTTQQQKDGPTGCPFFCGLKSLDFPFYSTEEKINGERIGLTGNGRYFLFKSTFGTEPEKSRCFGAG